MTISDAPAASRVSPKAMESAPLPPRQAEASPVYAGPFDCSVAPSVTRTALSSASALARPRPHSTSATGAGTASRSTSASASPPPSRASTPPLAPPLPSIKNLPNLAFPSTSASLSTTTATTTNSAITNTITSSTSGTTALSSSSHQLVDDKEYIDPQARVFETLLLADAPVDEQKLRRAARAGIPARARPDVWNMLLGVTAFDTSHDAALRPRRLTQYAALAQLAVDSVDPAIPRRVRRALARSRAALAFGAAAAQRTSTGSATAATAGGNSSNGVGSKDDVTASLSHGSVGVAGGGGGGISSASPVSDTVNDITSVANGNGNSTEIPFGSGVVAGNASGRGSGNISASGGSNGNVSISGSGSICSGGGSGNGNGLVASDTRGAGISDARVRLRSRSPPPTVALSMHDAEPPPAQPPPGGASAHARHRSAVRTVVDTQVATSFTRILAAYLEHAAPSISFDEHLVLLSAPFLDVMPTEADAFYAFSALMNVQQVLFNPSGLLDAVSNFLGMFRCVHADLYDHFVAEEVDINRWARNWLRCLLVNLLPRKSLLRLWDAYFAARPDDGLLLHPYVCLVFIQHLKPELQDCEDAESIMAVLSSLPAIDIDHVIAHAITARQQLRDRDIM